VAGGRLEGDDDFDDAFALEFLLNLRNVWMVSLSFCRLLTSSSRASRRSNSSMNSSSATKPMHECN